MAKYHAVAWILILCLSQATAQPKRHLVQPDRLDFGTLYKGAIVEASVLLYESGTDPAIPFEVTVPKFVKVLDKKTEARTFGAGNFISGSIILSIDTTALGDLNGDIEMSLGKAKGRVPVRAIVKEPRKGVARALIAGSPFHHNSTSDGTMFKAWTDLANAAQIDASYLFPKNGKPILRDLDLSKYDCVLLAEEGLFWSTPADLKRVKAYAEAGGRVLVTASAFFVGSVKMANAVISDYGLEMKDEESRFDPDVLLEGNDLDPELARNGVKAARFFRASPIRVTNFRSARVLVKASEVGQLGDGFVAVAKAGKGEVVALGQSIWWTWIRKERSQAADNAKLLRWLLIRRMQ